jgi:hypothetical protein
MLDSSGNEVPPDVEAGLKLATNLAALEDDTSAQTEVMFDALIDVANTLGEDRWPRTLQTALIYLVKEYLYPAYTELEVVTGRDPRVDARNALAAWLAASTHPDTKENHA